MHDREKSSSTHPSTPSPETRAIRPTAPPANAFSQAFLLEAARQAEPPASGPPCLTGEPFWLGPWEVEPVTLPHGPVWAVVRKGEPLAAGGRAVAVTRHRSDALLIAATLPALATTNHLTLGEKAKRLGIPIHDGALCLGHLSRPEPRIVDHLHIARTLITHPASFALAVHALGPEEIPILGRALMRRLQQLARS